ncbi:ERF family protein [Methylobacterium sp. B1]|uniref:ERF family protein n=1 Tax=Methylobacterium sp. B1 TaxID=91459 RepID=UPI00034C0927|nr:ERF family protein [Methylobacterium sp. B1]
MSQPQMQIVATEATSQAVTAASPTEGATVLSIIERMARDPNVDPDRVERFLVMAREDRAERARVAFIAAMAACQAELPRVFRDARNTHSGAPYARLETIARATQPVIARHGFSLSFDTEASPIQGHLRVKCTCAHEAGHERAYHLDLPPDTAGAQGKANKTPIQGIGSAITYARRYLVLQVFNIALTNDPDDTDGAPAADASEDVISDSQAETLRNLLTEHGIAPAKFLRVFNVESVPDLPADLYGEALAAIERAVARRAQPEGR